MTEELSLAACGADAEKVLPPFPWDAVVAHYEEIGLKGQNRPIFVRALGRNLAQALQHIPARVRTHWDRIVISAPSESLVAALVKASRVFGVAYLAPIRLLKRNVEEMTAVAVEYYRALASQGASFAIRVRRVDKSFPATSQELERTIGAAVVRETSAPVRLDSPEILIHFRVYEDSVYLVGPRVEGPGGLPVGTAGKVLTLFSGGIDSPVAAWFIMRRGCLTDFIHFHGFPDPEPVRGSKILRLIEALTHPQGFSARLFLVPYYPFQLALFSAAIPPQLELPLFRRFMVRVAQRVADDYGHQALVTGDNLGQAASQTLENLTVTEEVSDLPLLRPLLTFNKAEIIAWAQRIGTYDLSLEKYKDCCSILASHPETKANLRAVEAAESHLPLDKAAAQCLSEMVIWTIGGKEEGADALRRGATQPAREEP